MNTFRGRRLGAGTLAGLLFVSGLYSPVANSGIGGAMDGAFRGAVFGRAIGGRKTARKAAVVGGLMGAAASSEQAKRQRQAQTSQRRELEAARYREEEKLRQDRERDWDLQRKNDQLLSESQRSLIRLGYEPGPLGQESANLTSAIKQYQNDQNLLVTGAVSQELLVHMIRNGG